MKGGGWGGGGTEGDCVDYLQSDNVDYYLRSLSKSAKGDAKSPPPLLPSNLTGTLTW